MKYTNMLGMMLIFMVTMVAQTANLSNSIPIGEDGITITDLEDRAVKMQYCNSDGTQCCPPFVPTKLPLAVSPTNAILGHPAWRGLGRLYVIRGPYNYMVHLTNPIRPGVEMVAPIPAMKDAPRPK